MEQRNFRVLWNSPLTITIPVCMFNSDRGGDKPEIKP